MATNDELYELKDLYGIGRSLGATLINQYGHDAETIGEWLAEGFTADQIMEWPWGTKATHAKEYLDRGFTSSEGSLIIKNLGHHVSATKALYWRSAGFTADETWMGWKAYASKLRQHYKSNNSNHNVKEFNHLDAIKETQEYVDAGFSVEEYLYLMERSLSRTEQPVPDCAEISRWTQYGIPLDWVLYCIASGTDMAICKEWVDKRDDPTNPTNDSAIEWIEMGVSPERANEWLDMGYSLRDYQRANKSFDGQYQVLFAPHISEAYDNVRQSLNEVTTVFDSEDFDSTAVFIHLARIKSNLDLFAEHTQNTIDHFKGLIDSKEQEETQCLEQSVLL